MLRRVEVLRVRAQHEAGSLEPLFAALMYDEKACSMPTSVTAQLTAMSEAFLESFPNDVVGLTCRAWGCAWGGMRLLRS